MHDKNLHSASHRFAVWLLCLRQIVPKALALQSSTGLGVQDMT